MNEYMIVFTRSGRMTFEGTIKDIAEKYNCSTHEVETAFYTDRLFKEKLIIALNYIDFENKMKMINKLTLHRKFNNRKSRTEDIYE